VPEIINLKLGDMKEPIPEKILSEFKEKLFEKANLYPMNYDPLLEELAELHKLEKGNIVLINGVDEGIELISRAFGENILVFTPSYYEFVDAPKRNGFNYETKNCFDGKGFVLEYSEEEVKERSLIFICNPNNPFGLLSKEKIIGLAKKTNGIVAVDETYIDFSGETVINEFTQTPNLLVMRSFSKAFSLAGMRIGYIAGDKKLIDKINAIKLICNVSSVSVNAARIVLKEKAYFQKLIAKIMGAKDELEEFLQGKGFNTIHTHTNNVIIKFETKEKASSFYKFLKENNILVNQGNGVSTCGLDESFIRLNYGVEKDMQEFKKVVEKFLR